MLMTVKEVAEALGVSERSVWRWSTTGELPPGIKFGSAVRWSAATIHEYVERREKAALEEQRVLMAKKTGGPP